MSLDAQRLRRAEAAGRVVRLLSDVFALPSSTDSWHRRLMAATLAGAVVSHRSAAALHTLDGFRPQDSLIDVCFARGEHRDLQALGAVASHTWSYTDRDDITQIDGIKVTSVARTLEQLGSVCSAAEVEVALDSALRQGARPRWIEATADRLRRSGPWGGNVLTQVLYAERRAGQLSESAREKLVERALVQGDLPAPQRQYVVRTASGENRLDLAFPEAKLGIEGHSKRFHFGHAATEGDAQRDMALAAEGWEILYVTWGMAKEPAFFLELLRRTYHRRVKILRAS